MGGVGAEGGEEGVGVERAAVGRKAEGVLGGRGGRGRGGGAAQQHDKVAVLHALRGKGLSLGQRPPIVDELLLRARDAGVRLQDGSERVELGAAVDLEGWQGGLPLVLEKLG